MHIKLLYSLPVAAMFWGVSSRVEAMSFFTFQNRSAFEAALGTSGFTTETFDGVQTPSDFLNGSISVGDLTLSDDSGFRASIDLAPSTLPALNVNNTPLALLSARSANGATISFRSPVMAFGGTFTAISNDGRDTRAVFDDGSNLAIPFRGSGTSLVGDGFFGFVSDSPFSAFKIRRFDDKLADGFALDDAVFGTKPAPASPSQPVPTPALLPGIIGFGVAALRKRRQSNLS